MRTPLSLLLILIACDPLVGPDYLGEPLLEVRGEVTSLIEAAPPTEIALAWLVNDFNNEFGFHPVATTVPVEGQFPAGFVMRIYQPPPFPAFDNPLRPDGGFSIFGEPSNGRIALGFILALREGSGRDLTTLREVDLLGVSDLHFIIFAEGIPGLPDGYSLASVLTEDDPRVDAANECFNGVFDAQIECENPCFENDDVCWDACFVGPSEDQNACFDACGSNVDGCLINCEESFNDQLFACEALAPPPLAVVDNDSLQVRMFDNASAESIWQQLRPEDCAQASRAHADCVLACPDFEGECVELCAEEFAPRTCGGPAGVCEVLFEVQNLCFEDCFDEENRCFNECIDEDCDACFEGTNGCFFACELAYEDLDQEFCEQQNPPEFE